jgi:hypothetical protein
MDCNVLMIFSHLHMSKLFVLNLSEGGGCVGKRNNCETCGSVVG